jgi:D-serine deaminase-like pyridoxal phosphate-dependent protein
MDWRLDAIPEDHPTPSVIVSKEVVHKNIVSMQSYCSEHGLKLRPHTKTHKSILMAREQIAAGAVGLAVAKAGEAEVMAHASKDLMIAYPAIGTKRSSMVAELAAQVELRIGVDSTDAVDYLQAAAKKRGVTIGIMLDVEVGFHRTGVVDPNVAIRLGEYVSKQSNLAMRGLMCFPGHILPNAEQERWAAYEESLQKVVDGLRSRGIEVSTISGGSTPTARDSHRNRLLNEIRPGTYIYNDLNEVRLGVCTLDECAARVLATVVSTPERNKLVIDAGSKTLSSDRNAANPDAGWGYLPMFPQAKVYRLSEEHGEIQLSDQDIADASPPKVGDRLWLIPNHICVCINLQNQFYLHDGAQLQMLPVDARGLLV